MSDRPKSKSGKMTYVNWDVLKQASDENTCLVCLTERQVQLIIAGLVPLRWLTRYLNPDSSLVLPDMIDELEAELMNTCCDGVLYCILNDERIQQAIRDQIEKANRGGGEESLTDGTPSLATCAEDNVWAGVLELVKFVNRQIEDAFQKIELATNAIELIEEWFETIPIFGDLIALLPGFVNWLQESIEEVYLASYTQIVEEDIACDYFCLYLENCDLNARQLLEYHWNIVSTNPIPITAAELLEEAINGTWVGTQAVHIAFAAAYGFLVLGDAVNDTLPFLTIPSTRNLSTQIKLGANNPDSDWSIVCDVCTDTWSFRRGDGSGNDDVTIELYAGQNSPTATECRGAWDALNERWTGCNNGEVLPSLYAYSVRIRVDFGADVTLTRVDLFGYTESSRSNENNAMLFFDMLDSNETSYGLQFNAGVQQAYQWTGTQANVRYLDLYARSYDDVQRVTSNAWINAFTVYGEGARPVFLPAP